MSIFDISALIKAIPDHMNSFAPATKRVFKEARFWRGLSEIETPRNVIEEREGDDGNTYEYIKQFYTLRVLDTLFPGWTVKNWKLWYESAVRTWVFVGDLCVIYIDYDTGFSKERTVPGVGAQYVHSSTKDRGVPVKPDDMAKAARTEFIKNAGYWLGIGRDIYEQSIPASFKTELDEKLSLYDENEIIHTIINTIETKKRYAKIYR